MMDDKFNDLVKARNQEIADKSRDLAAFPDVQFSFWAFSQYRECPQKYIMFTVGRRQEVVKDNYWAIKGSVVHTALEEATKSVKDGKLDWPDVKDFMTERVEPVYNEFVETETIDWSAQGVSPSLHRRDALPEIYTSVDFLYSELCRKGLLPRDPDTIHSEFSFKTQLKDNEGRNLPVKITGRCDLVFEEPDGIIIVDPKDVTQRTSKSINWRQLVWYALGIEPVFGKRVIWSGFIMTYVRDWYLKHPDDRHPKMGGKTFRQVLFADILRTALAIRRNEFRAKLDRHTCHYCPVKHRCPDYYQWVGKNADLLNTIALLDEGTTEF